jgi:ATP-binding cassette subfamily B protein
MEKTLWQNLLSVVGFYRKRFTLATLMLLLANLLTLANPLLVRHALENPGTAPWKWALALLAIAFSSSLFRYRMRVEFSLVAKEVEQKARLHLFDRLQQQSRAFHDRHSVGELIERLSSDMGAYRDVVGPGLLFPVFLLTMILPGLFALAYISLPLALLTALSMIFIPLINLTFRKQIYKGAMRVQEQLAKMGKFVQEVFSGIRIVKSYVVEETLIRQFEKECADLLGMNFKLSSLQGIFFPLLTTVIRAVTLGIVLLAGLFFLSPADFVSFMWIQSYIFFPLLILGWVIPIWQHGRAAYDRIYQILDEPIEVEGGTHPHKIPKKPSIEITGLTFAYPQNPPLYQGLNLHIEGGTITALTGPAGGGKSTLFKLLSRDYEIPRGMIAIAGKDIHDYPLDSFWEEVITVDQIPFLFSKTIRENVRFAKRDATDEEVIGVSDLAALHDEVIGFEKGYDTVIGEKGIGLSGGQKSRLAIARAFLVDRNLLLLDDIFASLDEATADKIFNSLRAQFKGKTVVLTTSKAKLLEKMDKVVVIKGGKIIEEGSPETLFQKSSILKELKELEDGKHTSA